MSSNDEILALWAQLQSAISNAPMEELKGIIFDDFFKDAGAQEESNSSDSSRSIESICQTARDSFQDLQHSAVLGDHQAIELLVDISNHSSLQVNAWIKDATISSSDPAENNTPVDEGMDAEHWRDSLNSATENLINLNQDQLGSFDLILNKLPTPNFSFPIPPLLGKDHPPTPKVRLVSDLCDRLIQRRLNSECAQHTHQIAGNATMWPVSFSAYQYARKYKVDDILPNLNLGSSIEIDFSVEHRSQLGPAAIAMEVFVVLERERSKNRSSTHIEEWRQQESAADETIELNIPYEHGVPSKDGALFMGIDLSKPVWNMKNSWMRKAALLEPLDNSTIGKWTTAAYYYSVSICNGDFINYTWANSINKAITSTGSSKAGIKKVFKEGFKFIIKK